MSGSYEADEFAEVLALLSDGSTTTLFGQGGNDYVDRVTGDAGPPTPRVVSEDTVTLALGELAAGSYTLILGGRNSKKTTASENTLITFDNVLVEGTPIGPPNTPPVSQPDSFVTDEDSVLSGKNALADNGNGPDSDDDGDGLTVTEVNGNAGTVGQAFNVISTGGRSGQVTIATTGAFTFDPLGSFQDLGQGDGDTVTVDYTISDSRGGIDTATVTIAVDGVNDTPTLSVNTGTAVGTGGTTLIAAAALAFSDADNTAGQLSYAVTAGPANGQLQLNGNPAAGFTQADLDAGLVTYAHGGGSNTSDGFTFSVSDGDGGEVTGQSFAITVVGAGFGRIEAEDYVDYFDLSPGNIGGAYRSDDVDIEVTSDAGGGFDVGWIEAGEWLSYPIIVPEAGAYDITARIASLNAGPFSLKASVDDAETTLTFDGTGGYQTWADAVGTLVLPAGAQTLRLDALSTGFNLNWIEFSETSTTPPIIDAGFDGGSEGFVYMDDVFRGTAQPVYANGIWISGGGIGDPGALRVDLGGINGNDIGTDELGTGMSGGWRTDFTLTASTDLTLTFTYQMNVSGAYDESPVQEYVETLVSLDGTLYGQDGNDTIARVDGESTRQPEIPRDVIGGTVTLDLGTLSAGDHTLILGGHNNRKTTTSENAFILFDDVRMEGTPTGPSNTAPEITSPTSVSVPENQTLAIDVSATDDSDSEGSGLTYSLSGGADQAQFAIDSTTGEATFETAPDFEAPVDADGDNDYEIQITVTDSGGLTDVQDITISVTDIDESPRPPASLADLEGTNGFVLGGPVLSLSRAGDVNGDGFEDVIGGSPSVRSTGGTSFVVFGKASGFGSLDSYRQEGDPSFGFSVSGGGDVDGNGLADVIIGNPAFGQSHVLLGRAADFGATTFTISGPPPSGFGDSVSNAGDMNGDGYADFITSGFYSDQSYVVFGTGSGFGADLDVSTLDGSNGFALTGPGGGARVSAAGDINGDGFADAVAGDTVVFGSGSGFGPTIDTASLDGSDGFAITGGAHAAHAGDVNGDGLGDLIIGTKVVFGRTSGFGAVLDVTSLNGTDGFAFTGGDGVGSVAAAGDVNGDGLDDVIIGAPFADGQTIDAGGAYIVFGQVSGFGSEFDLSTLAPEDGFFVAGEGGETNLYAGNPVAGAGDVNGDGFADIAIGSNFRDNPPYGPSILLGESYVVFGGDFTGAVSEQGDAGANTLTGTGGADVLIGAQGDDTLVGNGGTDVLYGGEGDDVLATGDTAFRRIDGGTGTDTLRLDRSGFAFDLTAISDLTIEEIERIDLRDGSGTHSLILDVLEVLNLSDTSNTLTVLGDAADTVDIRAGWSSQGIANGFETFTQGAATLVIDADITVSTVNVPPIAQDDAFSIGEDWVLGYPNVLEDNGNGEDRDDDGDSLTVTEVNGQAGDVGAALDIVSVGGRTGRLTIGADGELRFSAVAGFQDLAFSESDLVSVDYTVSDGNGGTDSATITITVWGENDPPVEVANAGMTATTGSATPILTSALSYTDVDTPPAEMLFTVTTAPANGQLELTDAPGSAIASFTQADLDAQRVVYVHGGGGDTADGFTFSVSDGFGDDVTGQNFTISVTNPQFSHIEAEDYVGYFDLSPGNNGGVYRTDDVDIEATTDTGGGFNVGWIEAGEWLSYPITVPEVGVYQITARVASPNAGPFSLKASVAGADTMLTFDGTGGYQTWANAAGTLVLPAGAETLRLDALSTGFNLNWIEFSETSAVPPIVDAGFDIGSDVFAYMDDTFRGTSQPAYASGSWVSGGGLGDPGALQVLLGGIDGNDIQAPGMSGGWKTDFTLAETTRLTLTFAYEMSVSGAYDESPVQEFVETLVSLDGTLYGRDGNDTIARVDGESTRQPENPRDVVGGTVTLDLGIQEAGDHTLILGGRNNRKTTTSENAIITFDDVLLEGAPFDPTNTPPNASDSTYRGYSLVPLTGEYVHGFDPDGDPLTVSRVNGLEANVGQAVNVVSAGGRTGQAIITANRALTFDPAGNFDDLQRGESDTVTVDYTISDGRGGTDTATATVIVEGAHEDVAEPNDTIPQAVDTGIHPNGATRFEVASYIGNNPNISDPRDDVDFFRLEMKAGERVTIDSDTVGNNSTWTEIILFDSAGFGVGGGQEGDPIPDDEF